MPWAFPVHSMSLVQIWSLSFASVVIWYPLWEKLPFRGLLQGQLIERGWKTIVGMRLKWRQHFRLSTRYGLSPLEP